MSSRASLRSRSRPAAICRYGRPTPWCAASRPACSTSPEIQTVYARTIGAPRDRLMADYAEDVIGVIQLELVDWRLRPPAAEILDRLRARPPICRA
jgi:hypothetical protein